MFSIRESPGCPWRPALRPGDGRIHGGELPLDPTRDLRRQSHVARLAGPIATPDHLVTVPRSKFAAFTTNMEGTVTDERVIRISIVQQDVKILATMRLQLVAEVTQTTRLKVLPDVNRRTVVEILAEDLQLAHDCAAEIIRARISTRPVARRHLERALHEPRFR